MLFASAPSRARAARLVLLLAVAATFAFALARAYRYERTIERSRGFEVATLAGMDPQQSDHGFSIGPHGVFVGPEMSDADAEARATAGANLLVVRRAPSCCGLTLPSLQISATGRDGDFLDLGMSPRVDVAITWLPDPGVWRIAPQDLSFEEGLNRGYVWAVSADWRPWAITAMPDLFLDAKGDPIDPSTLAIAPAGTTASPLVFLRLAAGPLIALALLLSFEASLRRRARLSTARGGTLRNGAITFRADGALVSAAHIRLSDGAVTVLEAAAHGQSYRDVPLLDARSVLKGTPKLLASRATRQARYAAGGIALGLVVAVLSFVRPSLDVTFPTFTKVTPNTVKV
jgi:hypothetical protein